MEEIQLKGVYWSDESHIMKNILKGFSQESSLRNPNRGK